MKIYLAGPMSGLPDHNYPAFNAAALTLRSMGFTVLSPAENPEPCPDPTWTDWMRISVKQLADADAVVMLPGWQESKGARTEVYLGTQLKLATVPYERFLLNGKEDFTNQLEKRHA